MWDLLDFKGIQVRGVSLTAEKDCREPRAVSACLCVFRASEDGSLNFFFFASLFPCNFDKVSCAYQRMCFTRYVCSQTTAYVQLTEQSCECLSKLSSIARHSLWVFLFPWNL